MRPFVAVLLLVTLSPFFARAAEEPGLPAPPPGEAADGWVRLFDGGDFSGLRIEGDARAEEGVLVIGGAGTVRLSVKKELGDDFEIRLIYRMEGPGQLHVVTRTSGLTGSGSIGMGLTPPEAVNAVPGAAPEWQELRFVCGPDAARHVYGIRLEYWRDGQAVATHPATLGMQGDSPEVWFEVPAGTKLLLRGATVHPDPTAGSWWRTPWPFAAALLVLLVVIAAVVLLVVRRMRRRVVARTVPPLDDDLPSDGGSAE